MALPHLLIFVLLNLMKRNVEIAAMEIDFCVIKNTTNIGGDLGAKIFQHSSKESSYHCINWCLSQFKDANFWQFIHIQRMCYCKQIDQLTNKSEGYANVESGSLKPVTNASTCQQHITVDIGTDFFRAGLIRPMAPRPMTQPSVNYCFNTSSFIHGQELYQQKTTQCKKICNGDRRCDAFMFDGPSCWIYEDAGIKDVFPGNSNIGFKTGTKHCPVPDTYCHYSSTHIIGIAYNITSPITVSDDCVKLCDGVKLCEAYTFDGTSCSLYTDFDRYKIQPGPEVYKSGYKVLAETNQTEAETNQNICPIAADGGWSEWSAFRPCSVTCGGGTTSRGRLCNNPAPSMGGKQCTGAYTDSGSCNSQPCPQCVVGQGHDYTGTVSVTQSSRVCQRWDSTKPHEPKGRGADKKWFPGGDINHNHCRNPQLGMKPWCYTMDQDTRWEYCDIPKCVKQKLVPDIDCYTGEWGMDYLGNKNTTKNGAECLKWDDVDYVDGTSFDSDPSKFKGNYCRGTEEFSPWCFLASDSSQFEHCDVPKCDVPDVLNI